MWEDKVTELTDVKYKTDSWKDEYGRPFMDTFFKDTVRNVRSVIPNKLKKLYHYGVQPIFNSLVLESFNENYLKANTITVEKCIEFCPADFTWYGEYLLYTKVIDIVPSECLFLCFHSKKQYLDYIEKYTIDDLRKMFLGLVINSLFYTGPEYDELYEKSDLPIGHKWMISKSLQVKKFDGYYSFLNNK